MLFRSSPGARILFTDPTVVTGLVTAEEIKSRSLIGVYVFSAPAANEASIADAGFRLIDCDDRTENMATVASRWHDARESYCDELVADEGQATFDGVQQFLQTSHRLALERRLSRYVYLATS